MTLAKFNAARNLSAYLKTHGIEINDLQCQEIIGWITDAVKAEILADAKISRLAERI